MDQMNPPQLAVHLPAPVIQTFVFQLDRSLNLDKTVETALMLRRNVLGGHNHPDSTPILNGFGAATVDIVCGRDMFVMVHNTVQMDQMNPLLLVVHLPAPVIQTFVFQLDRRFYLDKTVETALLFMGGLVGAATVDSVCIRISSVMVVNQTVQMDQMNPPPPAPVIQTFVFQQDRRFSLDKTVETVLLMMEILVGAATVDSV